MFTQTLMVPVALPVFVLLRTTQWYGVYGHSSMHTPTFNGMVYLLVWESLFTKLDSPVHTYS